MLHNYVSDDVVAIENYIFIRLDRQISQIPWWRY